MKIPAYLACICLIAPLFSCGGGQTSEIDYKGYGTADKPFDVDMTMKFLEDTNDDRSSRGDTVYYTKGVVKKATGIGVDSNNGIWWGSLLLEGTNGDLITTFRQWNDEYKSIYSTNYKMLFNGDPGTLAGYEVVLSWGGDAWAINPIRNATLESFSRFPVKKEYQKSPKRNTYMLFPLGHLPSETNGAYDTLLSDLDKDFRKKSEEQRQTYAFKHNISGNFSGSLELETPPGERYAFKSISFYSNVLDTSSLKPFTITLHTTKGMGFMEDFEELERELTWNDGIATASFGSDEFVTRINFGDENGKDYTLLFSIGVEIHDPVNRYSE